MGRLESDEKWSLDSRLRRSRASLRFTTEARPVRQPLLQFGEIPQRRKMRTQEL